MESAAELKHKRLKSEVCICVCGRTLECGSPCLFHLLLGECWHLFAMCVMCICVYSLIGRGQRGTARGGQTQQVQGRGGGVRAGIEVVHACVYWDSDETRLSRKRWL